MHNLNKLQVYQTARENLRDIIQISRTIREFGDLKNQIERSALSVVSNIAEGSGQNSDKQFIRFLGYARASNKELEAQLEIVHDLSPHIGVEDLLQRIDYCTAMLVKLICKLQIA